MEPTAGLHKAALVNRFFTDEETNPFDTVEWEVRDAGAGTFFQKDVEVPKFWSDDSIGVVAKLYFATVDSVRETSVRQMIHRVVAKMTVEGVNQRHFGSRPLLRGIAESPHDLDAFLQNLEPSDPARIFYDELCYICLHQVAGFNTPTWINIGVPGRKQCGHACYPLSIKDHMLGEDGIVDWWRKEAIIFKSGGGAGINLSNLRGSMETLSTGGTASGPLSYMRAANAGAETLKSGGVHRRAAKFVCLDADHPDIEEFVWCKVREDERMVDLMKAGHDLSIFTAEGERNVAEVTSFQSANNSICVSDDFMSAVKEDADWVLTARTTGEITKTVKARELLQKVAKAAWLCADPGIIFIDTINAWHTTPSLGFITTTNTCGEICQNDDTACNLAALNILKFICNDCTFDTLAFRHVVDVMMTAMDIVCGFSELPTERITQNTRDLRQCGLGFTNLGAAIMAQGLPYDSVEGRDFAAASTALLTGRAYHHSAVMAREIGAFTHYHDNRLKMHEVVDKHIDALQETTQDSHIWNAAATDWGMARSMGLEHGYRNSQATAMMPTGTVSFLLGADTTGIEPALSIITHKQLAAAGKMTMVNRSARRAAEMLGGYSEDNLLALAKGDTSCISPEDLPVFATAMGENSIEPMGHVRMVAAIQPFVSQAISKTTNLPHEASVEDIYEIYLAAWEMGVKVLSVYRDGSKATQVLTSGDAKKNVEEEIKGLDRPSAREESVVVSPVSHEPVRRRLPRTRQALCHKIHVRSTMGDHEGYVSAGLYPDGTLGEVFLEGFGRMGGFTQNVLAAWATAFSVGLQYGVPFEVLVRKHIGHSDETGGMVVPDPDGTPMVIRTCDSIVDYIARWLVAEFGSVDLQDELGVMTDAVKKRKSVEVDAVPSMGSSGSMDIVPGGIISALLAAPNGNGHGRSLSDVVGPPCGDCGGTMYRAGACWQCKCGNHTGCG